MEEKTIREVLDAYGKYTSFTSGYSMWPLIKNQRDNIIVVKNTDRLKKYDIALYEGKNGKYIMHRVVEVHDDHYIIIGDNCITKEYVTDDMVVGVLAGFYKRGKRYIDCRDGKAQKLYAKIWVALSPLRPAMLFAEKCVRAFRNKLFRKKRDGN